jgi:hydroxyquinol 1,2-dioxygenase
MTSDASIETDRPLAHDQALAPLTAAVLRSLEGVADPRTRALLSAAVAAAHGVARDLHVQPHELIVAAQFLTRVGQASDDVRKEFVLLSDVLGLTMVADENGSIGDGLSFETSALGPFHRPDSPAIPFGGVLGRPVTDGDPMHISFDVIDVEGRPVGGAVLDMWLANSEGLYENQDPQQPDMNLRGHMRSTDRGEVRFWTVRPRCYPIPDDGPVGDLLRLANRLPWRPAHIHVVVNAPGYAPVVSALFLAGDPYLDSDAVFAVKDSLIVDCVPTTELPPGGDTGGARWSITHRIVLARQSS